MGELGSAWTGRTPCPGWLQLDVVLRQSQSTRTSLREELDDLAEKIQDTGLLHPINIEFKTQLERKHLLSEIRMNYYLYWAVYRCDTDIYRVRRVHCVNECMWYGVLQGQRGLVQYCSLIVHIILLNYLFHRNLVSAESYSITSLLIQILYSQRSGTELPYSETNLSV